VKRYKTTSIAVVAAIEAGTGLVLVSFPSLFVQLLLGIEVSEPGQIVGRLAGFALIALVLACWPRGGNEGAAASSLLVFSVLVALYLVYLGIGGTFAGPLLWPAAALHSVAAIFVACTWVNASRSGLEI
jgi:hypothetical protein